MVIIFLFCKNYEGNTACPHTLGMIVASIAALDFTRALARRG